MIEQDQGRGLQPVAFDSRKLSDTKARYSAYERELLGVVYAIGKWRHYVEGRHFTVRTDHSSLRHLPNQPSVNRRIWKWIAILADIRLHNRPHSRSSQPSRCTDTQGLVGRQSSCTSRPGRGRRSCGEITSVRNSN